MLKRLSVAFAALFVLATQAFAAGTIPYSLSQQFDKFGHVLAGCKLNIIQAGTVGTPQIAYQDTALTLPVPGGSLLTCDAAGRLPQFFLADGNIKILLTDKNGLTQVTADNILVIGNSSGGGGGSPVDPTTVLTTGDIKSTYGTGVVTGFVRLNGRTIGSASSGAAERANSDCQALFQYLWNIDPSLTVSTGRGASANADWVANKQITLPDGRGRALFGLDDMGSSAAGRLTTFTLGSGTVLGAVGGFEKWSLALTQLPTGITMSGLNTVTVTGPNGHTVWIDATLGSGNFTGGSTQLPLGGSASTTVQFSGTNTTNATSTNTGGQAHPTQPPTILVTIYIKL